MRSDSLGGEKEGLADPAVGESSGQTPKDFPFSSGKAGEPAVGTRGRYGLVHDFGVYHCLSGLDPIQGADECVPVGYALLEQVAATIRCLFE
jgi:hypothetical protein